jgi:hypothetical protein
MQNEGKIYWLPIFLKISTMPTHINVGLRRSNGRMAQLIEPSG